MARTYINSSTTSRKKQPLLQRGRVKYRFKRSSEQENLESNFLRLDIVRVSNALTSIDNRIESDTKLFIGSIKDVDQQSDLEDGLKYPLNGVQYYSEEASPTLQDLEIETIEVLSSKISRLIEKVSRLEREK